MVYTKEKNVQVIMKFEVPKRHNLGPILSTNMVQRVFACGRGKRGAMVEKARAQGREMML